jgi:hypothetical protein
MASSLTNHARIKLLLENVKQMHEDLLLKQQHWVTLDANLKKRSEDMDEREVKLEEKDKLLNIDKKRIRSVISKLETDTKEVTSLLTVLRARETQSDPIMANSSNGSGNSSGNNENKNNDKSGMLSTPSSSSSSSNPAGNNNGTSESVTSPKNTSNNNDNNGTNDASSSSSSSSSLPSSSGSAQNSRTRMNDLAMKEQLLQSLIHDIDQITMKEREEEMRQLQTDLEHARANAKKSARELEGATTTLQDYLKKDVELKEDREAKIQSLLEEVDQEKKDIKSTLEKLSLNKQKQPQAYQPGQQDQHKYERKHQHQQGQGQSNHHYDGLPVGANVLVDIDNDKQNEEFEFQIDPTTGEALIIHRSQLPLYTNNNNNNNNDKGVDNNHDDQVNIGSLMTKLKDLQKTVDRQKHENAELRRNFNATLNSNGSNALNQTGFMNTKSNIVVGAAPTTTITTTTTTTSLTTSTAVNDNVIDNGAGTVTGNGVEKKYHFLMEMHKIKLQTCAFEKVYFHFHH